MQQAGPKSGGNKNKVDGRHNSGDKNVIDKHAIVKGAPNNGNNNVVGSKAKGRGNITNSGNPTEVRGNPVSGNPTEVRGNPTEVRGNPTNSGNPTEVRGNPVNGTLQDNRHHQNEKCIYSAGTIISGDGNNSAGNIS